LASCDAVIVGSGPNGLAAAIVLARRGLSVQVFEASDSLGGGARSAALTLPGFVHDVCAAVFPIAVASPLFRELPLAQHGLQWLYPSVSVAHPLDDGPAAVIAPNMQLTLDSLGGDAPAYRRVFEPFVERTSALWPELLAPLHVPRHPLLLARFGRHALRAATAFARAHFREPRAQALFAGCAAHSFFPLTQPLSAALGVVMTIAGHSPGWPYVAGGAQRLTDALVAYARGLGVRFVSGQRVRTIDELPTARAYVLDVSPAQLADIAGSRLGAHYVKRLRRYRYGPAVFKMDWALSEPIPWRDEACRRASIVHLGGTLEQITAAEAAVWAGTAVAEPFALVAQPTIVDATRAPRGRHTAWAYAHVPYAWSKDETSGIEASIERRAPGFRDTILARSALAPADLERNNPNELGGHIVGGVADAGQLFARPVARLVPYATPDPSIFICSSSTPPGAGVHGMCGYHAAHAALARRFRP
jgi:phytoene dehydrogenase-like protein